MSSVSNVTITRIDDVQPRYVTFPADQPTASPFRIIPKPVMLPSQPQPWGSPVVDSPGGHVVTSPGGPFIQAAGLTSPNIPLYQIQSPQQHLIYPMGIQSTPMGMQSPPMGMRSPAPPAVSSTTMAHPSSPSLLGCGFMSPGSDTSHGPLQINWGTAANNAYLPNGLFSPMPGSAPPRREAPTQRTTFPKTKDFQVSPRGLGLPIDMDIPTSNPQHPSRISPPAVGSQQFGNGMRQQRQFQNSYDDDQFPINNNNNNGSGSEESILDNLYPIKGQSCRHFEKGHCNYGKQCRFGHDESKQMGPDGKFLCRHWIRGYCEQGERCSFSHAVAIPQTSDGKYRCWHWRREGSCQMGDNCKFSHEGPAGTSENSSEVDSDGTGNNNDGQFAGFTANGSFKTPVCWHYSKGECTLGSACKFSHEDANSGPVQSQVVGVGQRMTYNEAETDDGSTAVDSEGETSSEQQYEETAGHQAFYYTTTQSCGAVTGNGCGNVNHPPVNGNGVDSMRCQE